MMILAACLFFLAIVAATFAGIYWTITKLSEDPMIRHRVWLYRRFDLVESSWLYNKSPDELTSWFSYAAGILFIIGVILLW